MHDTPLSKTPPPWTCARCGEPLSLGEIEIAYLGSAFPVELWHCKQCGLVLIPEELAMGRMLEVEKMLEDK
jgi:rubredoxin